MTSDELDRIVMDAEKVVKKVEDEIKYRGIMRLVDIWGYAIVDIDLDLSSKGLNNLVIEVPVTLSLDKRTVGRNRTINELDIKVVSYDHDELPSWFHYLQYPILPSNKFVVDGDWDCHDPYNPCLATGHCYFHVYSPYIKYLPSNSIYLDTDWPDHLYLYKRIVNDNSDNQYYIYQQDDNGQVVYQGVKFTFFESVSQEDLNLNKMVLIPKVKEES